MGGDVFIDFLSSNSAINHNGEHLEKSLQEEIFPSDVLDYTWRNFTKIGTLNKMQGKKWLKAAKSLFFRNFYKYIILCFVNLLGNTSSKVLNSSQVSTTYSASFALFGGEKQVGLKKAWQIIFG